MMNPEEQQRAMAKNRVQDIMDAGIPVIFNDSSRQGFTPKVVIGLILLFLVITAGVVFLTHLGII